MIPVVMDGVRVLLRLLAHAAGFAWLLLQPRGVIVAANLFLRKQLAMYRERGRRPLSVEGETPSLVASCLPVMPFGSR